MEVKAQVVSARVAWLNSVSKQLEKLLRQSGGVQNQVPIGSGCRGKLVHPESWLRRLVSFPPHSRCIEKIEIPYRGTESQDLREQMAELTLWVPDMVHLQAFKERRLRAGPLEAIVPHHGEPDSKAFQMVDAEFLDQSTDNTLSVLAHGSGG